MKKIGLSVLIIITTIVAIILNFNSALQGGSAVLLDSLVSFVFLGIWIFVFRYAVKHKEYNLILPFILFWIITLLTTLTTIIVNISDMTINFIIPFVIVFLTPLYGVRILGASYILALVVIAIISIGFIVYGLYNIIKTKKMGT